MRPGDLARRKDCTGKRGKARNLTRPEHDLLFDPWVVADRLFGNLVESDDLHCSVPISASIFFLLFRSHFLSGNGPQPIVRPGDDSRVFSLVSRLPREGVDDVVVEVFLHALLPLSVNVVVANRTERDQVLFHVFSALYM